MNQIEKMEFKAAIKRVDASFALEGFKPTERETRIDAAILAGRVTTTQVLNELCAYAYQHKSLHGFIESRAWA